MVPKHYLRLRLTHSTLFVYVRCIDSPVVWQPIINEKAIDAALSSNFPKIAIFTFILYCYSLELYPSSKLAPWNFFVSPAQNCEWWKKTFNVQNEQIFRSNFVFFHTTSLFLHYVCKKEAAFWAHTCCNSFSVHYTEHFIT